MKARSTFWLWRCVSRTALILFSVVACAGCACFRNDRRSYQEIEQRNQEFEKQKNYWVGPEGYGWWGNWDP